MTNRINKNQLLYRVKLLNALFGEDEDAWTKGADGQFKANSGTFVLDCAYGGYRLSRICNDGGGERDLTPRATARETYYAINAYIDGAIAMQTSSYSLAAYFPSTEALASLTIRNNK